MEKEYEILNNLYNGYKVYYKENDILNKYVEKGMLLKLSGEARYNTWFMSNYESGMERYYDKFLDYTKH